MEIKYAYDEEKTRQYIDRELKKLDLEKEKTLGEYNGLMSELSNYKGSISEVSSSYKEAYDKVVEAGTIDYLSITDSDKLMNSSKDIDELAASVEDLINQIKQLIEKYKIEYNAKVIKIKSHREYSAFVVGGELE